MKHSSSGTNQPSSPTDPFTTVRVKSPTPPGSCHQTAAATTTAAPIRNSPAPSRRCSGSSSRAVCPILRTLAPSTWATPSQSAVITRPAARKNFAIGPVPLRTARGEGRLDVLERPLEAGLLPRDRLPDDRLEDPEDFAAEREPDLEVPLFRDAGGEDVRVAMVRNLRDRHTSHTLHTPLGVGDRGPPGDRACRDHSTEITPRVHSPRRSTYPLAEHRPFGAQTPFRYVDLPESGSPQAR